DVRSTSVLRSLSQAGRTDTYASGRQARRTVDGWPGSLEALTDLEWQHCGSDTVRRGRRRRSARGAAHRRQVAFGNLDRLCPTAARALRTWTAQSQDLRAR